MALDINKKEKFIQLRVEGLSYEEISKKTGVSKPTLIKWGRQEVEKIKSQAKNFDRKFFTEAKEQYKVRLERLKKLQDKAYAALQKTNYEDLSTQEILNLILRYEKQLQKYLDIKSTEVPDVRIINIIKGTVIKRERVEEREPPKAEGFLGDG